MGTPEFAVASLDILVKNNYNVVGVVTVPDKPAGRGQQARHQCRRQAQARVRQGPGHDVRAGRHRRQAPRLRRS